MIRVVSWNMARRTASWAALHDVPADIALVQEAGRPDPSWANALGDSPIPTWETALVAGRGPWRTAVLRLSDAVELQARPTVTLETATSVDDWVVSRAGSWPRSSLRTVMRAHLLPLSPAAIDRNQTTGLRVRLGAPGPIHRRFGHSISRINGDPATTAAW